MMMEIKELSIASIHYLQVFTLLMESKEDLSIEYVTELITTMGGVLTVILVT